MPENMASKPRYDSWVWFGAWFGISFEACGHKFCHSWKHSDAYRSTIAFDTSFCLQNVYRNELGSDMFNLNHPKRTYYTNFEEKAKQCVEESPGCSNIVGASMSCWLVVEPNPAQKYARQKWVHLPQFSGWKLGRTNWNHPPIAIVIWGWLPWLFGDAYL